MTGTQAPIDVLRAYQTRAVRDVQRAHRQRRRVLLVEFMGTGKTVTAASIVRSWVAQGARVLILVHRGEILKQTLTKLKRAGLPAEMVGVIWGAHEGLNLDAPVQLASVQTIANREPVPGITHIVIDEAHHAQAATWRKVLAWYPEAKLLGLTATPERLDGKPLGEWFDHMVLGELAETLIADGWLAKPEIWTREDGWRPAKMKKRGGDYSPEEAARAMSGSTIVGGIPAAYLKHGEGLPAVLFAATKAQAKTLVAAFKKVRVTAETLFGEDSDDAREAKLARLKSGETRVLCTCDVLGEGWDFAGCRVVIVARPTASLARYMQWAGRAMRPGGKAIILDHAGNFYAHGAPWEDHEWSLEGRPKKPSLFVPSVDPEGRVTFIEPREVKGVLIRADHVERQTVCAGFKGLPCPTEEKPKPEVFCPRNVRARHGEPWRCHRCSGWHRSNVPVQFLKKVEQKTCAGWGVHICDKTVPASQLSPSRTWHRKGAPWRCFVCDRRNRSPLRAANPSLYVFTEQIVCPGYDGPCPTSAVATSKNLTPGAVFRRKGKPWRCRPCSNKAAASAPARVAMINQLARERVKKAESRRAKLQQQCPGWKGQCPNSAVCPVSSMAPFMVKRRGGKPWRCHLCSQRRRHSLSAKTRKAQN